MPVRFSAELAAAAVVLRTNPPRVPASVEADHMCARQPVPHLVQRHARHMWGGGVRGQRAAALVWCGVVWCDVV